MQRFEIPIWNLNIEFKEYVQKWCDSNQHDLTVKLILGPASYFDDEMILSLLD
jgi:hypothetical protein